MITFDKDVVYGLNLNYLPAIHSILKLKKPRDSQVDVFLVNSHIQPKRGGEEGLWDSLLHMYDLMQQYARKNAYDYVFIVDPDVILPENALIILIGTKGDIVCGITPERPSKFGFGKNTWSIMMEWNNNKGAKKAIAKNEIFYVTGCGSEACTLLNRKAIETDKLFVRTKYKNSPDFTFWENARMNALKTLCNPKVMCKHIEPDGTIIEGPKYA